MRLIGRRLALYALTAWVAITVNFLLPHFMPGNPIQTMIGKLTGQVTSAEIRAIRLSFGGGLNQSLLSQYFTYIGQLFHGNLGISITLGESVSSIIRDLAAVDDWPDRRVDDSQFLRRARLCGALLGWTRGSRLDSLIPTATFFQATPYFFLATVMLLVFARNLHWFPVLGSLQSKRRTPVGIGPSWRAFFDTENSR